jgi:hypothetical protein
MVWPLPPIFVIINPEVFVTTLMGKTSTDLRDIDGDSIVDLLQSSADDELFVTTSNVLRTNMLQSVYIVGRWLLVVGRWSLVVGRWSLVVGRWSLVVGRWSLVVGCWLLVNCSLMYYVCVVLCVVWCVYVI